VSALGPILGVAFALCLAAASIFSRRGLERAPFDVLLVTTLAVAAPLYVLLATVTVGFDGIPHRGLALAAVGAVAGSVVGRSLYLLGIKFVGPGKSLSISAASLPIAAVLSTVVLDERLTLLVVVGTLVITVGVVTIARDGRQEADRTGRSRAVLFVPLLSAWFIAGAVVLRKAALSTGMDPIHAGTVNMVVGVSVATPVVIAHRGRSLLSVDRWALRQFLIASVLMATGFVAYFVGLETTRANVFFPLVQTQPLFAVVLSAGLAGDIEVLSRWTAGGVLAVVVGAVLVVLS
jgi:drug/metabolite transporter (DMT)-like permease